MTEGSILGRICVTSFINGPYATLKTWRHHLVPCPPISIYKYFCWTQNFEFFLGWQRSALITSPKPTAPLTSPCPWILTRSPKTFQSWSYMSLPLSIRPTKRPRCSSHPASWKSVWPTATSPRPSQWLALASPSWNAVKTPSLLTTQLNLVTLNL